MPRSSNRAKKTAQVRVNQRLLLPLTVGVLVLLGLAYGWSLSRGLMAKLDRRVLDEYHQHGMKTPARDDIVVIAIDENSLSLSQAWPEDIAASPALQAMKKRFTSWPRRIWALALDRLFQAGARQVFLDLTFFGTTTPEDDKALADALKRYKGKVIVGGRFQTAEVLTHGVESNSDNSRILYPDPSITGSEIPDEGTWGYLNFWPDGDDVIRHARYKTTRWKIDHSVPDPADPNLPSVALALASQINVSASADAPDWTRFRFCPPSSYPEISLHEIFIPGFWSGNFDNGNVFKDKTILIGSTIQEEHDSLLTPLGMLPGVEIHAHALTALLARTFLADAPAWWVWAGLLIGAFIAWLLVSYARHPVLCLLALWIVTAGVVWITFNAFNKLSVELSPIPFTLALNGCGILGLTGNYLSQLRESRKLSRIVQRHHSPEHVAAMMKNREGLFHTLGGVRRSVTMIFSDIRGYTTLSEGMTPEELVTQINEYLSKMVEQIFLQNGSVDKFIGDAVMALWGSMREEDADGSGGRKDARQAVASALAMREALKLLNAGWSARGLPELQIGIGVHQGPVVVGYIGSASPHEFMQLTVMGDNVNLASRLEGITKEYGVDIIISEAVQAHVKDTVLCRSADLVRVKGKNLPVEVFAVMGKRGVAEPRGLADYELGIEAYRAGRFAEALEAMNRASDAGLNDALTAVYQDRCKDLIASPPEHWTGVYVMKKK